MTDINALLEEREQTHGNHVDVHNLVWELWECMIDTPEFRALPGYVKVELMMIQLKVGRGVFNPHGNDHFLDIQGFAELIRKEIKDRP